MTVSSIPSISNISLPPAMSVASNRHGLLIAILGVAVLTGCTSGESVIETNQADRKTATRSNEERTGEQTQTVQLDKSPELKSGLQPGDRAGSFLVEDITGPNTGDSICYACTFGNRVVVNIQTTKLTVELASLLKSLDSLVEAADKTTSRSKHAFLVYLTEDPDSAGRELKAFADQHEIRNIPLTIYDDLAGPDGYAINSSAETTIMGWSESMVVFNSAFEPWALSESSLLGVLKSIKFQFSD